MFFGGSGSPLPEVEGRNRARANPHLAATRERGHVPNMNVSALLTSRHGFSGVADGDHRPGVDPLAPERLRVALGGTVVRMVSQVHGARVLDTEHWAPGAEADALVSRRPGEIVAVRVADCVPILLEAPGAVAAIHAGWRGTAADIARAGLAALCAAAGCAPSAVRAAVGPCICGACYEVGDDVRDAVAAVTPGPAWRFGARNVDLGAANTAILRSEGVTVDHLALCTRCTPGFWSHRRDGAAGGRQVGAIVL